MSTCVIDTQRRVVMPKAWRLSSDTENTKFYLIPDSSSSIQIITVEDYRLLSHQIRYTPSASAEEANLRSSIAIYSQEIQLDKQGRFAISPELMQYAGLSDKVAFVGAFTHGRIFAPENWEKSQAPTKESVKYMTDLRSKAQPANPKPASPTPPS
ncbi:MAG TPA: hypothetical protein PKY10_08615 [Lentisphaeria bacterium]|nr:hypothetical protein [Lentisphaeria bacterium]